MELLLHHGNQIMLGPQINITRLYYVHSNGLYGTSFIHSIILSRYLAWGLKFDQSYNKRPRYASFYSFCPVRYES
jgi:hypothetical protein